MGDRQAPTLRCSNCGAPLKGVDPDETVECEVCHSEPIIDADPETEEDLDTDETELWLDEDQSLAVLREHLEEAADDFDSDELTLELDEDNTDDERVYLHVKDADGDVQAYFFVDRENGTLHVYDYDDDQWTDA